MAKASRLSAKSVAILRQIANGQSYSQILESDPTFRYFDIFAAAEEALQLSESILDYSKRMEKAKERYPRAYERWDAEDDARLRLLHREGNSIARIAVMLGRQPSAIRSRLKKQPLDESEHNESESTGM